MITVISLPHTGNNFIAALLRHNGVECDIVHCDPWGFNSVYDKREGITKVVSPIREPIKVVGSLVKRTWDKALAIQYVNDCLPLFMVVEKMFNCFRVPIDSIDVDALASFVGFSVRPDFDDYPRNAMPGDVELTDAEIARMSEIRSYWNYG